jgi:hypothetical protein
MGVVQSALFEPPEPPPPSAPPAPPEWLPPAPAAAPPAPPPPTAAPALPPEPPALPPPAPPLTLPAMPRLPPLPVVPESPPVLGLVPALPPPESIVPPLLVEPDAPESVPPVALPPLAVAPAALPVPLAPPALAMWQPTLLGLQVAELVSFVGAAQAPSGSSKAKPSSGAFIRTRLGEPVESGPCPRNASGSRKIEGGTPNLVSGPRLGRFASSPNPKKPGDFETFCGNWREESRAFPQRASGTPALT